MNRYLVCFAISLMLLATACPAPRPRVASPPTHGQVIARGKPARFDCRQRQAQGPGSRHMIRTASVSIGTDRPGFAFHLITAETGKRGGYVTQARQHRQGASLTLRVPSFRLEEALCLLAGMGEITELSINGNDAQHQLAAVNARVEQLSRLAKSAAPDSEMSATFAQWVVAQLESARQEKLRLDDQIALATIQVTIVAS
jgi:hypothetical protein